MLAFAVRVVYIGEKQGFHCDEILSRITAVGRVTEGTGFLNHNHSFNNGEAIKNLYFGKATNSTLKDIKQLSIDNYGDNVHPCLYYQLLRVALNFSDDFKLAGCALNLLIFSFSFFIMRKLLLRLFGDNKLVPIGLCFAFLNTGTISATLFIRPYELQMLAFILVSYLFAREWKVNVKEGLLLCFGLTFAFLSGYYIVAYTALLAIVLIIKSIKDKKKVAFYIACAIIALGVTLIWYRGYFSFLGSQRFSNGLNFSDYLFNGVMYFCNLINFLFYWVVLILLGFCFFFKNGKFEVPPIWICAFLWALGIAVISPFTALRYIVPALPVLSMILIYIIKSVKNQNLFATLFVGIYFLAAMFPARVESADSFFPANNKNKFHLGARIENLYQAEFTKTKLDIPIIVKSSYWFTPLYIINHLENEKEYLFEIENSPKTEVTNREVSHYYLWAEVYISQIELDTKRFEIKPVGNFAKYRIFEVKQLTKASSNL